MFTLINLRITILYHDRGRNIAHRASKRTFMQSDGSSKVHNSNALCARSLFFGFFKQNKVGPVTKSGQ